MDRPLKQMLLGLAVATAVGLAGCHTIEAPQFKSPFGGDKDDGKPDMKKVLPPQKMVSLWSNTVYTAPGKPATRGLAARVYFYDANRETVPVEGSLIVYGYDDSKSTGTNRQPDRKYVFKSEQLASHYSVSDFGPSYSIWIPWDQVGEDEKDVSLVPVFKGNDGKSIMGEHTQHVLPGPSTVVTSRTQSLGTHDLLPSSPPASANRDVRLATYEAAGGSLANANDDIGTTSGVTPQLHSTSIKLPPAVRDRLLQSTIRNPNQGLPSAPVSLDFPSQFPSPASAVPTMRLPGVPSSGVTMSGTQSVSRSEDPLPTAESSRVADNRPVEAMFLSEPSGQISAQDSSSALARIRSKMNSRRRLPSTHFGPATPPVPASPTQPPAPLPPATQPSPSGWPSVPAWPPGQPLGN